MGWAGRLAGRGAEAGPERRGCPWTPKPVIPGGLCPPSQGARVVCEGPGLVPAPGAEKHQPLPGVCPAGPLGRRGLGAAASTGAAGALSLLFVAFSLPTVRLSQTRGSGLGGELCRARRGARRGVGVGAGTALPRVGEAHAVTPGLQEPQVLTVQKPWPQGGGVRPTGSGQRGPSS